MIALTYLVGVIAAADGVFAFSETQNRAFGHLEARQNIAPGSELYNCHDNCGEAILEVKGNPSGICSDNIFLADYAACLICAGPNNDNIWQYYGSSLTKAAASCGLATTPNAEKATTTITNALPAATGASAGTTSAASSASNIVSASNVASSPEAVSAPNTASAIATSQVVTTTTTAASSSDAVSASVSPFGSSEAASSSADVFTSSQVATTTTIPTPTGTSNGTATSTATHIVTAGASSMHVMDISVFGGAAALLGALLL